MSQMVVFFPGLKLLFLTYQGKVDLLINFPVSMAFNPPLTFFVLAAGRDLLVHPVTEEGASGVTAYLPGKDEVRGVDLIFPFLTH